MVSVLKLPDFKDEWGKTRAALLNALGKWDGLDDEILLVVAEQLDGRSDRNSRYYMGASNISSTAAMFFHTRPQPNNKVLGAISDHLENTDWTSRKGALEAFGNWSQLSDEILTNIAAHLGNYITSETAFKVMMKQEALPFTVLKQYMQWMYEASLQTSFSEHIYWLADGKPCITIGGRKVYWVKSRNDGADLDADDIKWLQESVLKWRQGLKRKHSS
ncbi:hypothetical protein PFICI_13575 [Pestalotiopsis fici W106-1]|uniref:HEAT repeat domain-containing protein n=1 Tax=Pestalotiopsis fici (strain W106-1 / CGMCC3.15140) TaxID=1229662 RepID=W3WQI0_PESFW|nr:uncharacterized protein PFICI_13575 [Pestalotiopsis fici W106-1]ETS75091.1 hypothetical protein PFICI_13575 [Pestalotiopsis fici W106-1]